MLYIDVVHLYVLSHKGQRTEKEKEQDGVGREQEPVEKVDR